MARRIRSIKPEILEDEVVASLPHLEWRMFVSLFVLADDYGNLRGRAAMVRGAALWARDESDSQVQDALDSLVAKGLLAPYEVRNQQYLHICGWGKHQRVDKPGKPIVPGPVEDSRDSRENSRESREPFATDLDLEGKGRDQERSEPLAPPALALVPVEPKKRTPSGPHQEAIASFDTAYQEQNGARPTWNAASAKIIGELVKAHGAPEVQRRIEILFLGQGPPWLRPPFDVKTLSTHFDKLAKPHTPAPARSAVPANDERDRIRKIPDLGGRRP
jgi:hypothetical protein